MRPWRTSTISVVSSTSTLQLSSAFCTPTTPPHPTFSRYQFIEMFALTASTRNVTRISPTLMSALAYTQPIASNDTLPIGLGFSIAGPSNISMSTITVLSDLAGFTADTTTTNSSDATALDELSSRRGSFHRRDSGNKVCSSPAAPVLQCAATLPSMPFSPPAAQSPVMLQSSVMPWVFTPPVTTPATPGHDDAHDEGYFPPIQSFQAASAWMSSANQSVSYFVFSESYYITDSLFFDRLPPGTLDLASLPAAALLLLPISIQAAGRKCPPTSLRQLRHTSKHATTALLLPTLIRAPALL